MRKVAINTRFLISNRLEGFGWFTYYVSKYLVEHNPNVEFFFLFDRKYDEKFIFGKNVTPVVLFPQARHPILFKWWFDYSVARFLNKKQVDVFLSPDGYLSLRSDTPQIAVIHDLNFEHFPEDLKPHHARYLRNYFPKFANKASDIITVSEFSRRDIMRTYGIGRDKIHVSYNGVSDVFTPGVDKSLASPPYFLFVGSIHPRKNLKRLLLAFERFKSSRDNDYRLLVVGDAYFWSNDMKKTLANLNCLEFIDFKPYASLEDLKLYYQKATALMFVSYFEGFGIPIIEAMACGCPVVVAKDTACDEVAGDAALKIDPFNIEDITQAMMQLSQNENTRQELIKKGIQRAAEFSWEKTGMAVQSVLNKYIS
jgi:glycosyltransferase involved in cell wall biosynthesis